MTIRNRKTFNLFLLFSLTLLLISFAAPTQCRAFETIIDVAPNTLNLQSNGNVVTVHTDIDFGDVDVSTVYLNGIAIKSWKEDNQGNFVAKFLLDDVKDLPLVIDDFNTLKIVGLTMSDLSFWGEEDIMVVNNMPTGKE